LVVGIFIAGLKWAQDAINNGVVINRCNGDAERFGDGE